MAPLPSVELPVPRAAVLGVAAVTSAAVGATMVVDVRLGVAVVLALFYVPLVVLNLPVAVALWVPTAFLNNVRAMSFAPELAGLLIVFAWAGLVAARRRRAPGALRDQAPMLLAQGMPIGWVLLSMAWAERAPVGSEQFFGWLVSGVIVLVVVSTFRERRHLRLLAGAFVVGALISTAIGFADGIPSADSSSESAHDERAGGGIGDANAFAAAVVPAILLAGALAVGARTNFRRLLLAIAAAALTLAFAAAQSRGGLLAAGVAGLAALTVAKRERGWVLAFGLCAVGAAAVWFAANPAAWVRISDFGGADSERSGGTGRSELWTIAWRMCQDHPIFGVGLDGFTDRAASYATSTGPLRYSRYITEQPHVVHNTYLQVLVETGVVGLLAFVGVLMACLRAAWVAARRYEQAGDLAMAALSRGVLVAGLSVATSSLFLSNATERRTWVLLALGVALCRAAATVPPIPVRQPRAGPALAVPSPRARVR